MDKVAFSTTIVLDSSPSNDAEVVATGLITGVGGQGCVHHGVAIKESWFRVQLGGR